MRDRFRTACRIFPLVVMFSLVSPALFAQTTYTSVFPQFASGGGWSSDFFIGNQSNTTSTVTLAFVGDDGNPLTVDTSMGSGSSFTITMGGGNTDIVRAGSGGALKTGYALLTFPTGTSIRGSEVFRYSPNGAAISTLGVAQQFAGTGYSFPAEVDVTGGVNTGIAIANGSFDTSGSVSQTFVVSLIRGDGALQAVTTVTLASGAHISKYLTDLYPGLTGFSGTVCVSATKAFGFVALRQDQAVFGTVSVDTGPFLSPFMLSTPPISEVEHNDSTAQAQRISLPVVISGNILFAGDVDYFQFSGKQGDIVTALVTTQDLGSGLDSVLYLLNPDGTTALASNDNNGLFFESDSFIQAVLPSGGTYYFAVTDAQGRGGANGYYRLHAQVLTPVAQGMSPKTAGRD
jgi:hypothetical protein